MPKRSKENQHRVLVLMYMHQNRMKITTPISFHVVRIASSIGRALGSQSDAEVCGSY
jgi:hypothetical protein